MVTLGNTISVEHKGSQVSWVKSWLRSEKVWAENIDNAFKKLSCEGRDNNRAVAGDKYGEKEKFFSAKYLQISLWPPLLPASSNLKDHCDYTGPTQISLVP